MVTALAAQPDAVIEVTSPGTVVSIGHKAVDRDRPHRLMAAV